jgi:TRAP-type uncharacterized transport system substrate-binding protein
MNMKAVAYSAALATAVAAGSFMAQAQDMKFFRIASGSAGGTYWPMAGLLAQVISNPPGARTCAKGGNCGMDGLVAIAQSAHGSVANVNSLKSDQIESGFAQSDVTFWAYTGTGPFNKKVAMGLPASGALVGARLVVGAYGLDEKKDFTPEYVKSKTGADKIRDGHLDAFITVTGYPNASVMEMSATQGAKLVPVDGKARDALIKKAPFYSADVIPGGTYKGNPNDTQTVTVSALWVSRSNLPEDLHYGVVKGLFGNKKAAKVLKNGHAKGKSITLDTHSVGVPIPYCAGAAKFFKEAGVYQKP